MFLSAGSKTGMLPVPEPAAVPPDGLLTLTYPEGPGQFSTNFIAVREKCSLHLQEKYDIAGRLLDHGAYILRSTRTRDAFASWYDVPEAEVHVEGTVIRWGQGPEVVPAASRQQRHAFMTGNSK